MTPPSPDLLRLAGEAVRLAEVARVQVQHTNVEPSVMLPADDMQALAVGYIALAERLAGVEWCATGHDDDPCCPTCWAWKRIGKHDEGCALAAFLSGQPDAT